MFGIGSRFLVVLTGELEELPVLFCEDPLALARGPCIVLKRRVSCRLDLNACYKIVKK